MYNTKERSWLYWEEGLQVAEKNASSIDYSNKIREQFILNGLNSRFKGVHRDAREGKGNFSYKESKPISEKIALTEMTNYKFHTLGDNTLIEGLRKKGDGFEKVFYANKSSNATIKALKVKQDKKQAKQYEEMKKSRIDVQSKEKRTTTTYDRWKSGHDKKFRDWFFG